MPHLWGFWLILVQPILSFVCACARFQPFWTISDVKGVFRLSRPTQSRWASGQHSREQEFRKGLAKAQKTWLMVQAKPTWHDWWSGKTWWKACHEVQVFVNGIRDLDLVEAIWLSWLCVNNKKMLASTFESAGLHSKTSSSRKDPHLKWWDRGWDYMKKLMAFFGGENAGINSIQVEWNTQLQAKCKATNFKEFQVQEVV